MSSEQLSELELLGWGFERSLHPEDRDRLLATRQQAINKNQPYQITYRLQAADSSYNSFLEQGTPVKDNWVVCCQAQNFSLLEPLPQHHLTSLPPTPLAVIEWNLNFEVVKWDVAAEAIFGYCSREVIGRHAASLIVTAGSSEQVNQVWGELIQQRGGTCSINENLTKEGKVIVCQWYNH